MFVSEAIGSAQSIGRVTQPFWIFAAQWLYLVCLLIALVYFLRQPRARQVRMVGFAVVFLPLCLVAAKVAGAVHVDPRPFVVRHFTPLVPHGPDNGFVSDHALLTSAVATLVIYFDVGWGALLWALALVVSKARVYVGLHHPQDVIASMLIAVALSPLGYLAARWAGRRFGVGARPRS